MQVSQMKRVISQEQWKQRIVECRNSGVPVKELCREQGISYSTYYRHEQTCNRSTTAVKQKAGAKLGSSKFQIFFLQMSGSLSDHGSRLFKNVRSFGSCSRP